MPNILAIAVFAALILVPFVALALVVARRQEGATIWSWQFWRPFLVRVILLVVFSLIVVFLCIWAGSFLPGVD